MIHWLRILPTTCMAWVIIMPYVFLTDDMTPREGLPVKMHLSAQACMKLQLSAKL